MGSMVERAQIIVKGIVQGVGFRPYVFNLAGSLNLKGYVTNTSEGVLIEIEGARIPEFVQQLRTGAPPLSRITDVSVSQLPAIGYDDFIIRTSMDHASRSPFTLVSPDVSICDDCLREVFDPSDRRYLYPFINCTNCGPRYSITRSVPYDRPNTTMAGFTMCPDCLREYNDPHDRRFHAQPNACPICGPQAEFRKRNEPAAANTQCSGCGPTGAGIDGVWNGSALRETIALLRNGGIVAIKGLGGFHIACDAANDDAVRRLRERKRKSNKPFAVMSPDMRSIERFCAVSKNEQDVLGSIRRPIVLLRKRDERVLSEAVSPQNQYIGCMLPYTPLHYLLFGHPLHDGEAVSGPHFIALVMTSGNISEEPLVRDNHEALSKLSGMVDGFLLHDRDIFMRVDDSVVRVQSSGFRVQGPESRVQHKHQATDLDVCHSDVEHSELRTLNYELSFLRRSRGYAPDPIMLHHDGPEVLGCGADLKNTFTLTKGRFAIPSQHIGDMENYETLRFYEECLENLRSVYRVDPVAIVHDLHPGYMTSKWAIEFGMRNSECGMRTFGIQHHYAHIGSVMAEHGLDRKVIGVAFDGTGYGTDGNLWGGEFMIADIHGFERVGHLKYVALPGGEAAIKEPWRTAIAYVMETAGDRTDHLLEQTGFHQRYGKATVDQIKTIARSRDLSPLSSGAGRLFDAVSALIGVCDRNTFEGEAAMALEALTREGIDAQYVVEFKGKAGYTEVDFGPALQGIIRDLGDRIGQDIIATKFHNTVATVIRTMVRKMNGQFAIQDIALSGGTFQNRYLLDQVVARLAADNMNVYTNKGMPCNDACISLGQAYLVRERLKKSGMRTATGRAETECGI